MNSLVVPAACASTSGSAFGQGKPSVYPGKGEDRKQSEKYDYEKKRL
jgi:hypothetical protein